MATGKEIAAATLNKESKALLGEWLAEMRSAGVMGDGRMPEAELTAQGEEFLGLLAKAIGTGSDVSAKDWDATRAFLEGVSRSRALQGFSSAETATFIFSLKRPLFTRVRKAAESDPKGLADA